MDEWDELRKKIKTLEGTVKDVPPEVASVLDNISVADFWKKRYEQEKQIWDKELDRIKKEHESTKESALNEAQTSGELQFRVREMEIRLEAQRSHSEEQEKVKSLELDLEKARTHAEQRFRILEKESEKLLWEERSKCKSLETTIEQIRTRVRLLTGSCEQETRRREELEQEKARLENDNRAIQSRILNDLPEAQKRANQLEGEKLALQNQIERLEHDHEAALRRAQAVAEMKALADKRLRQIAFLKGKEKEHLEGLEDSARGFAHKVRNALGLISGKVQLSLAKFKMKEDLKRELVQIDKNAQEMIHAFEDYLSFTRMPEITRQEIPVNDLLSKAISSIADNAKTRDVTIEKKFSENLPVINADQAILEDAVKRILENALEASSKGKNVVVSSNLDNETGRIVIQVHDSGAGIPDDHLKKVFQPYFTTKKGKNGMGLYHSRRALDLHGGRVTVNSVLDQGTLVTLELPVNGD